MSLVGPEGGMRGTLAGGAELCFWIQTWRLSSDREQGDVKPGGKKWENPSGSGGSRLWPELV